MNTTTTNMVVPYITSWDSELGKVAAPNHRLGLRNIFTKETGYAKQVCYSDETPGDRDPAGVLWARQPFFRGKGKPMFAKVHAGRQRRAMMKLLCQVCGGPADRNHEGNLWVLTGAEAGNWKQRGCAVTASPPTCAVCVPEAQRLCPAVKREHAVVRVPGGVEAWGVGGALVGTDKMVEFPYGHPQLHMVLAMQLYVFLHDPGRYDGTMTGTVRAKEHSQIPR